MTKLVYSKTDRETDEVADRQKDRSFSRDLDYQSMVGRTDDGTILHPLLWQEVTENIESIKQIQKVKHLIEHLIEFQHVEAFHRSKQSAIGLK